MAALAYISLTCEDQLRLLYRFRDILLSAGECVPRTGRVCLFWVAGANLSA
jgi:hypothetical protein